MSLMKSSKSICKVLHQGQEIPNTNIGWAKNGLRAAMIKRTCVLTALKANHILAAPKEV